MSEQQVDNKMTDFPQTNTPERSDDSHATGHRNVSLRKSISIDDGFSSNGHLPIVFEETNSQLPEDGTQFVQRQEFDSIEERSSKNDQTMTAEVIDQKQIIEDVSNVTHGNTFHVTYGNQRQIPLSREIRRTLFNNLTAECPSVDEDEERGFPAVQEDREVGVVKGQTRQGQTACDQFHVTTTDGGKVIAEQHRLNTNGTIHDDATPEDSVTEKIPEKDHELKTKKSEEIDMVGGPGNARMESAVESSTKTRVCDFALFVSLFRMAFLPSS